MTNLENQYMPQGRRLGLRSRLFLAFFFTLLLPMACLMIYSNKAIVQGLRTLEDSSLEDSLRTSSAALDYMAEQMAANVQDYAHWDEMFHPETGRDPEWLREAITEWIPEQFDIDVIWLADQNGLIYYTYNVPQEFTQSVATIPLFLKARKGEETYEFIKTSNGVMIAASSFVSPTAVDRSFNALRQSPAVLFYGRYIDSDVAAQLATITGKEIQFFNELALVASSKKSQSLLVGSEIEAINPSIREVLAGRNELKIVDANEQAIFSPLSDSMNRRIGVIGVIDDVAIGNFVRSQLATSLLAGLLAALVVGVVLSWFFGSRMARAVKALNTQVQDYTKGDYHHEVEVNRRDELGELQASFAFLIKKLERAKINIHEQEMTILDILAQNGAQPTPPVKSVAKKTTRKRKTQS